MLEVTYLLGTLQTVDSEKLSKNKDIPQNLVILSVPGDFSRKPPIEGTLLHIYMYLQ